MVVMPLHTAVHHGAAGAAVHHHPALVAHHRSRASRRTRTPSPFRTPPSVAAQAECWAMCRGTPNLQCSVFTVILLGRGLLHLDVPAP